MRRDDFTPAVPERLRPTKGSSTLRVSVLRPDGSRKATTKVTPKVPGRVHLPAGPDDRLVLSRFHGNGRLVSRATRPARGAHVNANEVAPPRKRVKSPTRGIYNGPAMKVIPADRVAMASKPPEFKRPRLFGHRVSTRRLLT
jgi:hypothetical protein